MAAGVRQGWGGTGVGEKIEVERLNWVRERKKREFVFVEKSVESWRRKSSAELWCAQRCSHGWRNLTVGF